MAESVRHRSAVGFLSAWLWSLVTFLGVLLVLFALGMSNERDDRLLTFALLVLFVILPIFLAVASYRARSRAGSVVLLVGGLAWPLLMYWIVVYG
jgi:hypothetical protein